MKKLLLLLCLAALILSACGPAETPPPEPTAPPPPTAVPPTPTTPPPTSTPEPTLPPTETPIPVYQPGAPITRQSAQQLVQGDPIEVQGVVTDVSFSPDGQTLAITGARGLWFYHTVDLSMILHVEDKDLLNVDWSPQGDRVVTSSFGGGAAVWDAASGEVLVVFEGHGNIVQAADWSPDGRRVASSGGPQDETLRVWYPDDGVEEAALAGHDGAVFCAVWDPSSTFLMSCGMDSVAWMWDALGGYPMGQYLGHEKRVHEAAWSPDSKRAATGGQDGTVRLWNTQTNQALTASEPVGSVFGLAWAPAEELLASGHFDGMLRLWDTLTGEEIAVYDAHSKGVGGVDWSPAGDLLATGSEDGTVTLWRVE